MFAPEQHDLYDGHYLLSANRIYMVGGLNDPAGWDHMDNDAKTVKPVAGTAEIDVNDLTNTGKFEARLKLPEGDLVLAIDKFNEFNPCQNGGIVGLLHEHGTDSGCGDNNWPKTFVFLAGWGFGHATLNGKPLDDNYEMHFMITQGRLGRRVIGGVVFGWFLSATYRVLLDFSRQQPQFGGGSKNRYLPNGASPFGANL